MADLFEGAPPEWLQTTGEGVNNFLNNTLHAKALFDWMEGKTMENQAPEWLQKGGQAVYSATSPSAIRRAVDFTGDPTSAVAGEQQQNQTP